MTTPSVQTSHDALLRDHPEMAHEPCSLCVSTEKAKEVAVPADETTRTYTDVEHAAILEAEVARETAELRASTEDLRSEHAALQEKATGLEAEKAEFLNRVDVLEAEKSAAEAARDAAVQEFADYKTEQERAAQVETMKIERAAAVKAAFEGVEDDYFTDERVARWAEMSAEAFETVLEDLKATAAAFKPFGKKDEEDDEKKKKEEAAARESAAFKGGIVPTSDGAETALGQLFALNRKTA